jgi:hypothetical protein
MSVRGKTVAPALVVAALAAAGQAMACGAAVRITANGPSPAKVSVPVNDSVFWLSPSLARTDVRFTDLACSVSLPIRPVNGVLILAPPGCYDFAAPGTYSYSVTGFGAGKGAVVVVPPPLTTPPEPVVFGDSVPLVGEFPTPHSCAYASIGGLHEVSVFPLLRREATILARQYSRPEGEPIASLEAIGSRGAWVLEVTPTIRTTYQALLGDQGSVTATVEVRPRVDLKRVGGALRAHVESARSLAGAHVRVQVRSGHARWHDVRTLALGERGSVRFRAPLGGTQLRIFLPAREAGPGYVAGFSRAVAL